MRLRTFPAVLRIHSSKRKEGHEQYYSELLLFSYWRNEVNEFYANSPEECIAEHEKRKLEINANREKMYPGEATIELLDVGDLQTDGLSPPIKTDFENVTIIQEDGILWKYYGELQ